MKKVNMRVLGIESSCDETAAAVVENGRVIESSVIASQVDLHAQFGGVYPELASREHVKAVHATVNEALQQAHMGLGDLDGIAVTRGPGLAGSLVVGVNLAKGLALSADLPIVGVNHLEGHLYSAWLYQSGSKPTPEPKLPLLALLVSGGHTELVLMRDHLQYQMLGGTTDDAAGEAFDKVARLLELAYPGGPSIQKAAMQGNPRAFNFPKARLSEPWNFSFSGLKTAVLRTVEEFKSAKKPIPTADIAAVSRQRLWQPSSKRPSRQPVNLKRARSSWQAASAPIRPCAKLSVRRLNSGCTSRTSACAPTTLP